MKKYSCRNAKGKVRMHVFLFCFVLFYLFLAALGLCCCTQALSSCSEWGLLSIVVRGLLTAVASRCRAWAQAHGLQ